MSSSARPGLLGDGQSKHLGCRLPLSEFGAITPFLEAFPTNSHAIRWLLADPRVRQVMAEAARGEVEG